KNNGRNLKEFYINRSSNLLNLAIAEFCPNLRNLFTGFKNNELEALKMIFSNCQHLERIKFWCCLDYSNEKDLIEIVGKYSPKNFHQLKLCYSFHDPYNNIYDEIQSELLPEE